MQTFQLNTGYKMPVIGIGTFMLKNGVAEKSMYETIKDWYCLIDTACIYDNERGAEKAIHKAIEEGIVKREALFVTTKMWTSDYNHGKRAIEASLKRSGLDYIDLMILHHSQLKNDVKAYLDMEDAMKKSVLHSIGLSNYDVQNFDRLVSQANVKPAVLQNEVHPFYQNKDMKDHIAQYGTQLEAWFPIDSRGNTKQLFHHPVFQALANEYGKTPAQIILGWQFEAGNISIPGSSNAKHIKENIDIFDFAWNAEDMQKITDLDKHRCFAGY